MVTTPNFGFELIKQNKKLWSEKEHDNWRLADAVFGNYITVTSLQGVWENAIAVVVGDKYVDGDLGTIWQVATAHTTASSGTFADDRATNTDFWISVTISAAFQGQWTLGTAYNVNDYLFDTNRYGVVIAAFTSTVDYDTGVTDGNIITLIDLSTDLAAAEASAAAALVSENAAAADLVLTNADVVSTNADVVSTNNDVISTNADVVTTNQDAIDTAADVVLTGNDVTATNADVVATGNDVIATNADAVTTGNDVTTTNADVVITTQDALDTAADVVLTGLDVAATNADVVTTNADVVTIQANGLTDLTSGEVDQLKNIDTTVISADDWVALSNLVGTNTGDQTNITGNAATVTTVGASGDTLMYLMLAPIESGSIDPRTDTQLNYNSSTDELTLGSLIVSGTVDGVDIAAEETRLANTSGTNTGDEVSATLTVEGVVEQSTSAEGVTGTADDRFPSVAGVKEMIDTHAPAAGASTALDNLASVAINESLISDTDNTDDLGSTSKTWKDLYLGGGAYIGGAVAANYLDDYEEGTFTPVFADATGAGNAASATTAIGVYSKTGNTVTIHITFANIDTTGLTAGNNVSIQGLPFAGSSTYRYQGTVKLELTTFAGYVISEIGSFADYIKLTEVASGAGTDQLIVSEFTSTTADLQITMSYKTSV